MGCGGGGGVVTVTNTKRARQQEQQQDPAGPSLGGSRDSSSHSQPGNGPGLPSTAGEGGGGEQEASVEQGTLAGAAAAAPAPQPAAHAAAQLLGSSSVPGNSASADTDARLGERLAQLEARHDQLVAGMQRELLQQAEVLQRLAVSVANVAFTVQELRGANSGGGGAAESSRPPTDGSSAAFQQLQQQVVAAVGVLQQHSTQLVPLQQRMAQLEACILLLIQENSGQHVQRSQLASLGEQMQVASAHLTNLMAQMQPASPAQQPNAAPQPPGAAAAPAPLGSSPSASAFLAVAPTSAQPQPASAPGAGTTQAMDTLLALAGGSGPTGSAHLQDLVAGLLGVIGCMPPPSPPM